MTLKIELAVLGGALFSLGAFAALQSATAAPERKEARVSEFSSADFAAFDRNFSVQGAPCLVGLKDAALCFQPSPIETTLKIGDTLPADMPDMSAEFRVIVVTALKDEGLKTLRVGQTLVLADPETRKVMDVLNLAAPDFVQSKAPPHAG